MNILSEYHNTKKEKVSLHQSAVDGVGVGYRANHFEYIEKNKPTIPWFEVLIDNYMMEDGASIYYLEKTADAYPITFHSVGMSLGSVDKLNLEYFKKLKRLINQFQPVYVSDHLCWTSVGGYHSHDLLPMPYTDEAITAIVTHIKQAQEVLERKILIENVSSYMSFKDSAMQEWEFIKIVSELADCDILLDINNIYVSAVNHQFNAIDYLKNIPVERVKEMHLAGYSNMGSHLLDTHGEAVHQPVWDLYEKAQLQFGNVATLIEWDNDIPEFTVLEQEARKANVIMQQVRQNVA